MVAVESRAEPLSYGCSEGESGAALAPALVLATSTAELAGDAVTGEGTPGPTEGGTPSESGGGVGIPFISERIEVEEVEGLDTVGASTA